jgi:hypothetical protein
LTHCGFEQLASSDERNSRAATRRGSVIAVAIEPVDGMMKANNDGSYRLVHAAAKAGAAAMR